MKQIKNSVALVIKNYEQEFLIVKRPEDEDGPLAGVWGFPAITIKDNETEIDAAHRIGREKLGINVEIKGKIGDKVADRDSYILHLSDYEGATVKGSVPNVPQPDTSMTQYVELKYTQDPKLLFPAAQKGSLCSQVFLESIGLDWNT